MYNNCHSVSHNRRRKKSVRHRKTLLHTMVYRFQWTILILLLFAIFVSGMFYVFTRLSNLIYAYEVDHNSLHSSSAISSVAGSDNTNPECNVYTASDPGYGSGSSSDANYYPYQDAAGNSSSGSDTGSATDSNTYPDQAIDTTRGSSKMPEISEKYKVTYSNLPWNLTLANSCNPVPADYQPSLTRLRNGQAIDTRCYPDLQEMMDDCRRVGLHPIICSSYRTYQKQESLYQDEVDKYLAQGYSINAAKSKASTSVAIPGTSEHELGLAVDIVDRSNQRLNQYQENTAVQRWLMENSWQYGFILRYPKDRSDITGIIYEPWHYRYVGKEAAKEIHEKNITLEEYLNDIP